MIAVLASASAWAEIQAVAGDRRCFPARDEDELLRLAGDADAVVLEAENLVPVLRVVRHINRDHPLLPVILITEQNSVDLWHLASVFVELRRLGEECIRRHWRRDVNSQRIQRVKDLLDWIFLLHALSAKRPDRS